MMLSDDAAKASFPAEKKGLAGLYTFARSLVAGAAATIADLSVLALAVGALGLSPLMANAPSLLVGALVQFFANRHFAFQAKTGCIKRQAIWFTLTEIVALGLNGFMFDLVARMVPLDVFGALALRLGVSFAVFVGWSYPVWRRVFQSPSSARA